MKVKPLTVDRKLRSTDFEEWGFDSEAHRLCRQAVAIAVNEFISSLTITKVYADEPPWVKPGHIHLVTDDWSEEVRIKINLEAFLKQYDWDKEEATAWAAHLRKLAKIVEALGVE